MPAVAVRHERRRQEKKVVCVNNLNTGDREGTSNTTGNRRPSLLTLQSPHSQTDTPIISPPYIQNTLPDIYVCSKVSRPPPAHTPTHPKGQLYVQCIWLLLSQPLVNIVYQPGSHLTSAIILTQIGRLYLCRFQLVKKKLFLHHCMEFSSNYDSIFVIISYYVFNFLIRSGSELF